MKLGGESAQAFSLVVVVYHNYGGKDSMPSSRESVMAWKSRTIAVIVSTPNLIITILDWLLGIGERLVALGVSTAVFYLGWRFIAGRASASDSQFVLTLRLIKTGEFCWSY